jgi:hypothetical protein
MGEQTGNEREVRNGPLGGHGKHGEHGEHGGHGPAAARKVPGYPQDMMDMHGMHPEAHLKKINKPQTRGMRKDWYAGVEALMTVVRVLPPDLYDQVVSGKGDVAPGASVPGSGVGGVHQHKH